MDYKQLHRVWETPVNTLAFALIASLAIVAGPLGLAAYLIAIVAISAIATWVNTNIFSYIFIRRNRYKDVYYA